MDKSDILFGIGILVADIIVGVGSAYLGSEHPLMVVALFNVLGACATMAYDSLTIGR